LELNAPVRGNKREKKKRLAHNIFEKSINGIIGILYDELDEPLKRATSRI
jgi:hypothetical protein